MLDILLASYNGEKFIAKQLDSLMEQSCQDFNVIIHDDGSKDNTVSIIKKYQTGNSEKIKFIEDGIKFGSAKLNFNHLLNHSETDYTMFCDQDDEWKPEKVKKALKAIQSEEVKLGKSTPLLVFTDLTIVDGELNLISESMFEMQSLDGSKTDFKDYLLSNNATGCTVIINRALRELLVSVKMPEAVIMHDWWMALVAAAFGKVIYKNDREINYRQHGNNTEGAKKVSSVKYIIKMLRGDRIKKSLELTYLQAKAFKQEFGDKLSEDKKKILNAYISMQDTGKINKYKILKKYGFNKSGFVRKIAYWIYV